MDMQSDLDVESRYSQVLRVQTPTGKEIEDIKIYITEAVNETGIIFYKAQLYQSETAQECYYTIDFFLFSSRSMYWNQAVRDELKLKHLNKLLEKHQNIKLTFEDTTNMIHHERKVVVDVEQPSERSFRNVEGSNVVQKFLNWWLIVPRAQWDFFDLGYQLYTFDIFHQHYLGKVIHYLTVPINATMSMCFLAQFNFGGVNIGYAALSVNAAIALLAVLCVLYMITGFLRRTFLWAMISVFILFICWMVGNLWYQAYKMPGNPWYNPTSLGANPLLWYYVSSVIQCLSHTMDPQIPPYITGMSHWESYRTYFYFTRVPERRRCRQFGFIVFSVVTIPMFPVTVSAMSWPHLIGCEVLCLMVAWGYKPEIFQEYHRVLEKVKLAGNPVIHIYPRKTQHLLRNGRPHINGLSNGVLPYERKTLCGKRN